MAVCGLHPLCRQCSCQRCRAQAYRGPGYHPAAWMAVSACAILTGQRQRQGGPGPRASPAACPAGEQVAGHLLDLGAVVLRCALFGVDEGGPADFPEVPAGEAAAVLGSPRTPRCRCPGASGRSRRSPRARSPCYPRPQPARPKSWPPSSPEPHGSRCLGPPTRCARGQADRDPGAQPEGALSVAGSCNREPIWILSNMQRHNWYRAQIWMIGAAVGKQPMSGRPTEKVALHLWAANRVDVRRNFLVAAAWRQIWRSPAGADGPGLHARRSSLPPRTAEWYRSTTRRCCTTASPVPG